MNNPDPFATYPNPVMTAEAIFGQLTLEQRVLALAAAMVDEGAASEQRLRTAVFRASGQKTS